MQGFINSQKQVDILDCLERVGPCPLQPLELLFGRNTKKHLIKLRSTQYVYNITLNKIEFWSPQGYGHFNARKQELIAWLAVRIIEGGGKYDGDYGVSPTGVEFTVNLRSNFALLTMQGNTQCSASLDDLKQHIFRDCLKSYQKWDA